MRTNVTGRADDRVFCGVLTVIQNQVLLESRLRPGFAIAFPDQKRELYKQKVLQHESIYQVQDNIVLISLFLNRTGMRLERIARTVLSLLNSVAIRIKYDSMQSD